MESNGVKWVRLGDYIEQYYERNSLMVYNESNAIGVNIDKEIRPMQGHLGEKKFEIFLIVPPNHFVYNPRGSRKLGIGYNDTQNTYITTFNNIVFRLNHDIHGLIPEYLLLFVSRKEWDSYAEYLSWGSSTEVFTWETFCDVKIPLPSVAEQQKVVNVWRALRETKEQNEAKAAPLMQLCQSYIQELKHKYPMQEIGPYIQECNERNVGGRFTANEVRGIATSKGLIDTKANLDGVSLDSYKLVRPKEIAFVPDTSRRGDKMSLGLNDSDETYIVSSISSVFRVNEEDVLPDFLYLWFCRSEFDRYARFNSWGSAREVFSFEDMKRCRIPLPPIEVQQAIVNIYKCANEAKQIAEEADRLSREVCPALLQHVIHS